MYSAPDFVKVSTSAKDVFASYCEATVDYGVIFLQGDTNCGNEGYVTVMNNYEDLYAFQCWATPPR